ncbi:hypothetical protein P3T42_005978 [Paraburkholderia sp. GAS38]|jgi:hypothetical protein|uniref:hypothetical protein n=1 Tax=Paraburkholderia sp. GAS38 TaxID=3035133 RepID=UPI003D250C4D
MKRLSLKALGAILILSLLCARAVYAQPTEETLCEPHEEVYFSCPVKKKIVSVCASGNVSPDNGYVEYRIGNSEHIDFQYPDKPYPPGRHFSISDITGGNLNIVHLKFRSGGYDYVVYQGDVSGVYVKKNGKTVANLTCDAGIYQTLSPRAMRGIKTTPPVDGVD